MASALDGITVVDLTDGVAGAVATMFLADNGARVIKVVRADAIPQTAPGFRIWDRGKASVELDLAGVLEAKTGCGQPSARVAEDQASFDGLVRSADVLIESYAPSSPYQAIAGYGPLSAINRGLVHCSITAYGKTGPMRDKPPIDDLVMARLGVLANVPCFRPGPSHVVHPLPSMGAGLLAAQGVAAGLLARERRGRGVSVETSLMAGSLMTANKVLSEVDSTFRYPVHPAGGGPFYSVFECADGQWVHIACIHSGFVELAANAMGIWDTVSDPRFGGGYRPADEAARAELFDLVAGVMKTRPYSEWERIFEEADVPYGRACTTQEAMDDPQLHYSKMVVELDDPLLGGLQQMGLPIKMSETPGRIAGPAPVPGQDTEAVRSEVRRGGGETETAAQPDGPIPAPLSGIKVLELSNVIAGPAAGKFLTDLGAEVIKLESLTGDISRPTGGTFFLYLNSNKRSVSVNTRTQEGREAARKLAGGADVLLANMRPGAAERMGLGPTDLTKLNPDLIETHITGFGWDGPYSRRPGLDPLAQALTGLQRTQGGPDNPPVFLMWLAPTDYTAGAMAALGAILALLARERTGVVQRVDTALLYAGAVLNAEGFMRYEGMRPRRAADKDHFGLGALHRLYRTASRWIYLAADDEPAWSGLCEAVQRPDLAADPRFVSAARRSDNDPALAAELEHSFAAAGASEWVRRLEACGVPVSAVVEDHHESFFADPDIEAAGLTVEQQHPKLGRVRYSGRLIKFGSSEAPKGRPTPLLGEHTREALQEAGYSDGRINSLYEREIVMTEEP